jgi:hypothetical protein
MLKVNIKTLAEACEKNPKLLNICKGHSQILCKVALEQSGYTQDINKWNGRYCYIIKYLLDVISKSKNKISLTQKDKILKTIKDRRLDIPKNVIKFIEKNYMSMQSGKGPDKTNNIFDKYLEEIDELSENLKQREIYKKIDDLLDDLNQEHTLKVKLEELTNQFANADIRIRPQILKQIQVIQTKLNTLTPNDVSPASSDSSFNPFMGGITPGTPSSTTSSNVSNIFKTRKYVPRNASSPLTPTQKKSKSIYSMDSKNTESYFSDNQGSSYTLLSISENLPDILKSYFTRARLEGKFNIPENIIIPAMSNYRAKNDDELTIFDGNLIEIDMLYGNGKVRGKIIDTDNIVNITDMYRYGSFPITVFLQN